MSLVPVAVLSATLEQIFVWSRESCRISSRGGVLYNNFKDSEEFNTIRQYALDLGNNIEGIRGEKERRRREGEGAHSF
jgi:hypothetical protein